MIKSVVSKPNSQIMQPAVTSAVGPTKVIIGGRIMKGVVLESSAKKTTPSKSFKKRRRSCTVSPIVDARSLPICHDLGVFQGGQLEAGVHTSNTGIGAVNSVAEEGGKDDCLHEGKPS